MPESLSEWLAKLPNVSNVRPCALRIEGTTYPAARYEAPVVAPPGSRAALEHNTGRALRRRPPPTGERFYVLGERPVSHRRGNVAYVIDGEVWFIAGWAPANVAQDPKTAKFHPWGAWFGLHKWTLRESIDTYEEHPYERIDIEVTYA